MTEIDIIISDERFNQRLTQNKYGGRIGGTPTYRTWHAMRQRCNNPKNISYKYYGGRGITICERWSKFINFFIDMGKRPKELSIDRINNDGNYEPENCRWATQKEQNNNKGHNKLP